MMYYMNWVLTNAQIELIAADVSVIDYNGADNEKKFDEAEALKAVNKEWQERYGENKDGWKNIDIKDVLGKNFSQIAVKTNRYERE